MTSQTKSFHSLGGSQAGAMVPWSTLTLGAILAGGIAAMGYAQEQPAAKPAEPPPAAKAAQPAEKKPAPLRMARSSADTRCTP